MKGDAGASVPSAAEATSNPIGPVSTTSTAQQAALRAAALLASRAIDKRINANLYPRTTLRPP